MYPVSTAFQTEVLRSHTMVPKCEVYSNGAYIRDLILTDGQVTMDYTAQIQRRCKIDLQDTDGTFTPGALGDLLATAGNELKLYRGILLRSGTTELVPLGVFNISVNDITDGGAAHVVEVTGFDRSKKISSNRFATQYTIPAGTNVSVAIAAIASNRYPQVQLNLCNLNFLTPQIVASINDDPWNLMQKLATDAGCDLAFDGNGILVMTPILDPVQIPISVSYMEGNTNTALSINKRWKDDNLFNWIVVTGESAGSLPVYAEAHDDDPASPTYVNGNFGPHVKYYRSDTAITTDQAQQIANGLLFRYLGMYEVIRYNAVPHPALIPTDRVYIGRAVMKIANNYTLDKITMPMTAQRAMECTVRQR